ncbi:hypothetical protein FB451DRAFT_1206642 [Mycena latifolia]|nr:hypothetical protein FB451DRAFT_1206642 [Mycena latifolia]
MGLRRYRACTATAWALFWIEHVKLLRKLEVTWYRPVTGPRQRRVGGAENRPGRNARVDGSYARISEATLICREGGRT